jgi:hypothetical protein
MGWFKVDQVAARGRHSGTLSCALMKNSSKNGAIRLRVRLSRDVQQAAGLTGGDTLDLEWGEDELAGRVLLKKAGGDAGASRLRWQHPKSRAAVETGFSALPDGWFPGAGGRPTFLGLTVRPAASCPWKIEGAAIEVTLPEAWFSAPPDGARPVSRLKGAPEGHTPTAGEVAGRMLKEAATGSDRERAEVEVAEPMISMPFTVNVFTEPDAPPVSVVLPCDDTSCVYAPLASVSVTSRVPMTALSASVGWAPL